MSLTPRTGVDPVPAQPGRADLPAATTPASTAPAATAPSATALARSAAEAADRLLTPPTVGLGDVVPAPESVTPQPAADFVLPADAAVRVSADRAARDVAEHLAELLRPATGHPLPVTELTSAPGALVLTLAAAGPTTVPPAPAPAGATGIPGPRGAARSTETARPHEAARSDEATQAARSAQTARSDEVTVQAWGGEGYRLDVDAAEVRITANTATGLFYGVQTLRQLLPAAVESRTPAAERWAVPGGTIVDRPRFPYRGAMLDVARHFFGVEDVLRVIDHLARYKLNHLHLHLTDDQGWRIAVDSWPRLATVGGSTEVGGGPGGWYTAADYRRIVGYAARRHVTVVPEVDLPGHTNAALVAYPELAPGKVAPPPYTGTEVGFSHVDPTDERTYDFVADVLGEVAALTPGPWLHIGGDEAYKVKGSAYTGFVERVQRIVAGLGRTVVGWHQIAPAGQLDGRVLQWWGTNGDDPVVAEAVRRGARLILSPGNHAYLDMKYDPDTPLGHDWAGLIDVHRAYHWDPATHLTDVPAEAVLGVEAPLWTESVTSLAEIEFLFFPRLPALAELAWSAPSARNWVGFRERLAGHGPRWHAAGITFHPSPEIPWPPMGDSSPGVTEQWVRQPAPPTTPARQGS
ncbi:family 20 glycosylhydrolase [Micromonospora sp. NPDC051925]|uniref:family 20 glycosylhydrolase n=1 Tax=Micromonospora sp. NPDC051925 TaxID=3364288 RepID=UPI0037CA38F1